MKKLIIQWQVALLSIAAGYYFAVTSYLTIHKHYKFYTGAFDLGVFHNAILSASKGHLFNTFMCNQLSFFRQHFEPSLSLIVPFYWLAPCASTLLIFQSAVLTLAVIPLYLYTKSRLHSSNAALVLSFAYLLHPGLHEAHFYEFHEISILPFAYFSFFLGYQRKNWWLFYPALICCLGIKEDMWLLSMSTLIFIGLSEKWTRHLIIGLCLCFFWKELANFVTVSLGGQSPQPPLLALYYGDILGKDSDKASLGALLYNVLGNPKNTFNVVFRAQKFSYLAKVFLPFLFIPLIRWRSYFLLIHGLSVALLASWGPLYSFGYQYTLYLIVPGMIALIHGLELLNKWTQLIARFIKLRAGDLLRAALLLLILLSSIRSSYLLGAPLAPWHLWNQQSLPFELQYTDADKHRRADLLEVLKEIPPTATVACGHGFCGQIEHIWKQVSLFPKTDPPIDSKIDYLVIPKHPPMPSYGVFTKIPTGMIKVMENGDFILAKRGNP